MSHHTRRLLAALGSDPAVPADADLLARFARTRDAGAFELLVHRHAPLVLRACRGVLRDRHAAEDAAQATFLALARQAGSVHGSTLPGWLFRVARRVAVRAARRPLPTADADPDALPVVPTPMPDPSEVRALHDELARLPEAYRSPLLLAYFEGLTYAEVARRLGGPLGTVTGRVARAKTALAVRLARRGFAPAVLAVAADAVPPGFAAATTGAAVEFSAGPGTAGAVVTELAVREVRRASATRVGRVACAVAVCGAVALGLGVATGGDAPAPQPPAPQTPAPPPLVPAKVTLTAVVGKTFAAAPVTTDLQRRLLDAPPAARAVVLVNGPALFRDPSATDPLVNGAASSRDLTTIDPAALESDDLLTALAGCRPEKGRSVAVVHFHYPPSPATSAAGRRLLELTLEGVAGRAGFVPTLRTTHHNVEFGFAGYVRPLLDSAGPGRVAQGAKEDDAESAVGDERVRAYPVRTPLSRVLAGPVGGVVDVRVRLDLRDGDRVPGEVDRSARAALAALALPRGQTVNFLFRVGERDAGSADRLRRMMRDCTSTHGLMPGTLSY